MQSILSHLTSGELIWIIIAVFALLIGACKIIIDMTVKEMKRQKKEYEEDLKKISEKLDKLDDLLRKDIKGTKSMLYNDCREMLKKYQDIGAVTTTINDCFNEMWRWYMELGDGKGQSLKEAWDKIEINDTKYIQFMKK